MDSRKERELQWKLQSQASNIVKISPELKTHLDRYQDPEVSRLNLLRLQSLKFPLSKQLQKSVKKKERKVKKVSNIRGETARSIRDRRRFEVGERRYKDSEEPRIFGDPDPTAASAAAAAARTDQLRLAIEGRRITAQDRQQARLVDQLGRRGDDIREIIRGSTAAGADTARNEQLRLAIEGRRISAQDIQQARLVAQLGGARGERLEILDRSENERARAQALRDAEIILERQERDTLRHDGGVERDTLRQEAAIEKDRIRDDAAIEKDRILDEAGKELTRARGQSTREKNEIRDEGLAEIARTRASGLAEIARIRASGLTEIARTRASGEADAATLRAEAVVARDRFVEERGSILDKATLERNELRDTNEEFANLRYQERADDRIEREFLRQRADVSAQATDSIRETNRQERIQREQQIEARSVRDADTSKLVRQEATARAISREEGDFATRERLFNLLERDPIPEERDLSEADKRFLSHGIEQVGGAMERRLGETEARVEEQLRQHERNTRPQLPPPPPALEIEPPAGSRSEPPEGQVSEPSLASAGAPPSPSIEDLVKEIRGTLQEDISEEIERQKDISSRVRVEIEEASDTTGSDFSGQSDLVDDFLGGIDEADLPEREPEDRDIFDSQLTLRELPAGADRRGQTAIDFVGDRGGASDRDESLNRIEYEEPPTTQPERRPERPLFTERPKSPIPQHRLPKRLTEDDKRQQTIRVQQDNLNALKSELRLARAGSRRKKSGQRVGPGVSGFSSDQSQIEKSIRELEGQIDFNVKTARALKESSDVVRRAGQSGRGPQEERPRFGGGRQEERPRFGGGAATAVRPPPYSAPGAPRSGGRVEELQEEPIRQAANISEGPLLEEAEGQGVGIQSANPNLRLYEGLRTEIASFYARGKPSGGSRGNLPYTITNISNKSLKKLASGESQSIAMIEADEQIGYYPDSRGGLRGRGTSGITRITQKEVERLVKEGKIKITRK